MAAFPEQPPSHDSHDLEARDVHAQRPAPHPDVADLQAFPFLTDEFIDSLTIPQAREWAKCLHRTMRKNCSVSERREALKFYRDFTCDAHSQRLTAAEQAQAAAEAQAAAVQVAADATERQRRPDARAGCANNLRHAANIGDGAKVEGRENTLGVSNHHQLGPQPVVPPVKRPIGYRAGYPMPAAGSQGAQCRPQYQFPSTAQRAPPTGPPPAQQVWPHAPAWQQPVYHGSAQQGSPLPTAGSHPLAPPQALPQHGALPQPGSPFIGPPPGLAQRRHQPLGSQAGPIPMFANQANGPRAGPPVATPLQQQQQWQHHQWQQWQGHAAAVHPGVARQQQQQQQQAAPTTGVDGYGQQPGAVAYLGAPTPNGASEGNIGYGANAGYDAYANANNGYGGNHGYGGAN